MTSNPSRTPPTSRGKATRRKLLQAAEQVFSEYGYHDASIVKLTEAAGVGQGTFYLYFRTKEEIFEELVDDLNARARRAMEERAAPASTRVEAERLGLTGFLEFTLAHPALYRVIRQAEFVSPVAMHRHYERIAQPYTARLKRAMDSGEIAEGDPEVLAWSLMGIGELIGMRWILWGQWHDGGDEPRGIPEDVVDEAMAFIARGLGASGAAK